MADRSKSHSSPELEFRCEVVYFAERAAIHVRGELDASGAEVVLRQMLASLALPIRTLTVDLSRVTLLADPGIDALLLAKAQAHGLGIEFQLLSVPLTGEVDLVARHEPDHPS